MQMMDRNQMNHHMMMNNPYYMNHHNHKASTFGMWRQPIAGSNWRKGSHKPKALKVTRNRNEENYGNLATNEGTRFGKFSKKLRFQNRDNSISVNRFHGGGGDRFQPYVVAKKERGTDCLVTPAKPALVCDGTVFKDLEKEWGLDVYGTMRGLIRLRSPVNDGRGSISSCTDEDGNHAQFERRLSKFEIILPKSVSCLGGDLKSGGEDRSRQLENENFMLKESLYVMDRDMDDLKQRMEAVEMQFRAKGNMKVESGTDTGAIGVPSISNVDAIKMDESDDIKLENQHDDKKIWQNDLSDCPASL